jgi:hypothetical protein
MTSTNSVTGRIVVAGASLGGLRAAEQLRSAGWTSFWSDQYEYRLQSFGAPVLGTGDHRVLDGSVSGDVVVGYHAENRLVGLVALGGPKATGSAARFRAKMLPVRRVSWPASAAFSVPSRRPAARR